MKSLLLIFTFALSSLCFSQESLTKENGKIIVDIFMDAYQVGDTVKMKSVMHPYMTMQTAYLNTEQQNILRNVRPSDLLKYAATTAKAQKWEERLKDYVVQSDGNIAHVWTPYEFYMEGKFSHCGANSITLVYTDDSWKIFNIIDSRRIGSCIKE
ncbi:nuclear transport factor 2 family protein [Aequorivita sp. SDUM287046]|uniref:Nuclear transport factor 2 family protein n=1 Tax=Aequorivita aurantiaca TaxID=3053356 RepID=A0ABT8DJE4_9FLAO|nr:nuclear transport factor 2 family protein [Aequorivita aurantiaca]MDN3724056.1 nuclear transport factor 2 family protein [Aequorivita aurantiaca]